MTHSIYQQATYQVSAYHLFQLPPDQGIEVAFAGRSNVGKSSAINAITNNKGLARISKTPGRTQMINFFQLNLTCHLVDLPGYGYAKVPQEMKNQWKKNISSYLEQRQALRGIVLLMDIRHLLQPFDYQMLEWCRDCDLSVYILLTKSDKLKRGPGLDALRKATQLAREIIPTAELQLFSAQTKAGVKEAQVHLDSWFGFS
ncbi:ribosome biogenesis GTP-binding protein YihA/YsxC [Candidatus Nitrosacidococcus sp. I8]|uniref:ribosome biogenesis GTP-binding protein YihA/YsxC n=1 Tax=Candidatus Nitrosacidococcus sp. I8 TaxID=2942908 RepID=UPI002226CEDE|nr:ribosome biogenesis GTP-binding protein YihA/YsxC [Candidatus Nitrosacidococcus sp. I8]CAH9019276.1 putative GTP-binding protein EngB [Candidatus Nitrosacidococcus sp. I8]